MIKLIIAVINMVFLLLSAKFNKDAEDEQKKKELHDEAKEAIKSGDLSRVNMLINKLRK